MHVFYSLIRESAPLINTIIICGCVLLLVTCYLLGVDTRTPQQGGDQPNISDAHSLEDDIPDRRNKSNAIICNVSIYGCTCTNWNRSSSRFSAEKLLHVNCVFRSLIDSPLVLELIAFRDNHVLHTVQTMYIFVYMCTCHLLFL